MKKDGNRDSFISSNIKVAYNLENKLQYFLHIFYLFENHLKFLSTTFSRYIVYKNSILMKILFLLKLLFNDIINKYLYIIIQWNNHMMNKYINILRLKTILF